MTSKHPAAARGVTLVELMVGLAIGLICTVIVTQVFSIAEGQKRSTTSGSDAQVNGALALYALQRDVQMAGYGLTTENTVLGCDLRAWRGGVAANWTLAPVVITDGASGAPDTIVTLSSTNMNASLPTKVTEDHLASGTDFLVGTRVGVRAGDVMIAVPPTIDATHWCSVLNVTSVADDGAGHHVRHVADATTGPWNPDPASSIFPATGYPAGSYLISVGQMIRRTYSINSETLRDAVINTQAGIAEGAPSELFPQIVNLQALYGKDTDNDRVVDVYDNVTPTTAAGWRQVLSVRIAVVARSTQYEKDEVTVAEPVWDVGATPTVTGSTTCGSSQCITLKVDGLTDWKHYRYKVYDSVVPLRNMLWSS
ncbi:MAG TPA: PilW family protein [Albitalea sp.]|uniref:PilW family protein n=1 Tax=Piscinibacter sp. TaxID=1903157 RepID=UPI002ED54724